MTSSRQLDSKTEAYITEHEMLQYVDSRGYPISKSLVDYYYKHQCLAHREQKHIVGISGSVIVYPARSAAQLLAICKIRERTKRYDAAHICFLLWLEGFDIPIPAIRRSMHSLLLSISKSLLSQIRRPTRDTLAAAEQLASRYQPHNVKTSFGVRMHDHLKKWDDRRSFLVTLIQLMLGGRPYFGGDALGEKSLAQLFVEVLELEPAQTTHVGEVTPWLPMDISPTLEEMGRRRVLSLTRLAKALLNPTPKELEQARADREALGDSLPRIVRSLTVMCGPNPFGLGLLAEMDSDDPSFLAVQIAGLLVMRKSGYSLGIDALGQLAREQANQFEQMAELILLFRTEVPTIAQTLDDAMQRLLRGESQTEINDRVRLIAPQFKADFEAFWEQHPDLASTWKSVA